MEADFIAELHFLTTKQGGRKDYTTSGYRPHIEFEGHPEYLTSGHQTYIDKNIVEPGDKVRAEIVIVSNKYFTNRLFKKMKFTFSEGPLIIGHGEIIEIINKKLIKQ